ncbi:MAG TPA: polysaccharide deacetylase family protein [Clostridia bacterium]|nr:polysaccharide deacetylase family protein [Clostridia bacterium]
MKLAYAILNRLGANALRAAAAALCVLAAVLSFAEGIRENVAGEVATGVNDNGPMIALTFDDGPYPGVTSEILDVLEEYNVKATFFVLGSRVKGYENTLRRMEELECEVGNHTWSHADLTTLSSSQIVSEIENTNEEFKRVLGHGAAVVRPPFGFYNSTVRRLVPYPLVLWTIDTGDWQRQDPGRLTEKVLEQTKEGCVILMHDQQTTTAEAMRDIIPALIRAGFRFVTISEMIEEEGTQATAVKFPP